MTLEQKIRNAYPAGNFVGQFFMITVDSDTQYFIKDDLEGVLTVDVYSSGRTTTKYLNGDTFYTTHEEAFNAEL